MNRKEPGVGIDLYMSFFHLKLLQAIAIQGWVTILLDIITGAADRDAVAKLE